AATNGSAVEVDGFHVCYWCGMIEGQLPRIRECAPLFDFGRCRVASGPGGIGCKANATRNPHCEPRHELRRLK
ncbi:MAG: hypothetical protein ACI9S9_004778, partial [Planctomycetota bacterium]